MASINRVRSGWKKFKELSGVLTNKVALRLKGRVYVYEMQCCDDVVLRHTPVFHQLLVETLLEQ